MSIRTKLAVVVAGTGVLGAVALGAGPAFAANGPSASGTATVTVTQSISFSFTSPTSFNLSPGVTQANAIAFNVQTNDHSGYTISLSAPDPTSGGGLSFPAGDLAYDTNEAGVGQLYTPVALSNSPAQIASANIAPSVNGDSFTQDWTANIPSNTPPGSYTTTLTFVATGK